MQAQARQRAEGRHLVVTEQELVLDDQLPVRIEDGHPIIAKPDRQKFGQDAERVVDAQRVRRLAKPTPGTSKAGRRSMSTTSTPRRANAAAAVKPPTPPPTTSTRRISLMLPRGLTDNPTVASIKISAKDAVVMHIKIRRTFVVIEERREEAGRVSNLPLRRVAAVAIVENPYAGRYVDDLKPMIDGSVTLGKELGALALSAFGDHEVQSYGKGGIVGR